MQNAKPVVLITAASQGIGRAIATHLARTWTVVLLARSETIETIGAALGGLGVRGSVTDEADLKQLVDTALQRFGRIDAVVSTVNGPARLFHNVSPESHWLAFRLRGTRSNRQGIGGFNPPKQHRQHIFDAGATRPARCCRNQRR